MTGFPPGVAAGSHDSLCLLKFLPRWYVYDYVNSEARGNDCSFRGPEPFGLLFDAFAQVVSFS